MKSFRLFLRLTWEPFGTRFQPIQDKFLAHTLIVVRSAGVEDLVKKYEKEQKEDLGDKGKLLYIFICSIFSPRYPGSMITPG